jgi:hypothetical protein
LVSGGHDANAPDLLEPHRPKKGRDTENHTTLSDDRGSTYAHARLRRDRPDIHACVLAGEIADDAFAEAMCAEGLWPACGRQARHKRAVVAVARKLAGIMHSMWVDGTEFRLSAQGSTGDEHVADMRTALARREIVALSAF